MTDKKRIKEEFDSFKSAYRNLETMTEGMTPEEIELIHKIQVVLQAHEDELEAAAVEIIAEEEEDGLLVTEDDLWDTESMESPEGEEAFEDEIFAGPISTPGESLDVPEDSDSEETPKESAGEEELPVPPVGDRKPDVFDRIGARFSRWNPKSRLLGWVAKDRHNATFAAMILVLIATCAGMAIDYAIPENVTVVYETVAKFDKIEMETRKSTVDEVLKESGLEIGEKDKITPIREHDVTDGMEIRVRHATNATAKIGGKEMELLLVPGTVEDNLLLNDIKYDDDDRISPSLNTKITDDTKIVVDYIDVKTVKKTEKVKSRSLVKLDPTLTSGVEEKVSGHDGKAVYEYKTTYVNGKKAKTKKSVKKWIRKVQNTELRLGTSLTGHKGEYEIKEQFTGNTTAYWMGNNARGASGGRCVYGTCAVDPKRIPYGTNMWIEGYGYARANDCGGAIKNDHVDLWMHNYRESCQWGRRFVTVYVFK